MTDNTKDQTPGEQPPVDERRNGSDRRVGPPDRRSGIPRRVRNKFVLFNRRSGNGRRLLVKGRRYGNERRETLATLD